MRVCVYPTGQLELTLPNLFIHNMHLDLSVMVHWDGLM